MRRATGRPSRRAEATATTSAGVEATGEEALVSDLPEDAAGGETICPGCDGSGKVDGEQCATCGGSGKVVEPAGGA